MMNKRSNFLSIHIFVVTASLFLFGCASTRHQRTTTGADFSAAKPSRLTAVSSSSNSSIKAGIDALLPDSLFPPAHIGIKVVSLNTNETLYELNSTSLFNPASNQKLFTSATALTTLGETFPLVTLIRIDTLSNTIFLKGHGDPILSAEDLDSVARLTVMRLPPGKVWRVAGDNTYFDDKYWGYGWNWDDEPEPYQPFLSALMLNYNTIKVFVAPGLTPGSAPRVRTEPVTGFVAIDNRAMTTSDSVLTPLNISRTRRTETNTLTITGEILLADSERNTELTVWQPGLYTTTVFAEQLRKRGVNVCDVVLDTVSTGSFEVARFSHQLDSVVTYLNKVSDNLSAEALLKVLASEKKAVPGSAMAGITVEKEFLSMNGVDTTAIRIVDGSGLSRHNLTSPDVVIRLLEAMYRSPHFTAYYHSLPIAGVDGTNRSRMKQTAAEGNLRAKTGTLSAVTALSGYVQTSDGEWLAFSMMMMNYPTGARVYRQVQDNIGVFLSRMRREDF